MSPFSHAQLVNSPLMFLCWPQTHSCGWKKKNGAWLPGGLHVDEPSQVHVGLLQFVQQDSPFSVQVLSGQGQTVAGGMWWCCSATKYATSFVQHRRVGKAAWSPARTWRHVVFSHVTPNVSSHLHWLFNGLVPFYIITKRPPDDSTIFFCFSGVDIGDEHPVVSEVVCGGNHRRAGQNNHVNIIW